MPQAAFADSTTAPEIHPRTRVDIDHFSRVVQKIEALAYMVGTSLDGGRPHEDIRNGIVYLLEEQSDDLRSIFDSFHKEREFWDHSSTFARVMERLSERAPEGVASFDHIQRHVLPSMGRMGHNISFTAHDSIVKALKDKSAEMAITTQTLMRLIIVQWLMGQGCIEANATSQEASA